MRVHIDYDRNDFAQAARAFLLADEAVNGPLIASALPSAPAPGPASRTVTASNDPGGRPSAHGARVVADGRIVLAAAFLADRGAALSLGPAPAAVALAESLVAEDMPLRAVSGPEQPVEAFAARWAALSGRAPRLATCMHLMELRRVTPPRAAPGNARAATPADEPVLAAWLAAFITEALPHQVDEVPRLTSGIAKAVTDGRLHIWEHDGVPVSQAATSRSTPTGIAVNAVYTPRALRGRGFASNLVAGLSAAQLAAGKTFCCLYADVANPTSNRIYEAMGYRVLVDTVHYQLPAA